MIPIQELFNQHQRYEYEIETIKREINLFLFCYSKDLYKNDEQSKYTIHKNNNTLSNNFLNEKLETEKKIQRSTNLRIRRSKHQNASASSSRSIIMGEQRSLIPECHKVKILEIFKSMR